MGEWSWSESVRGISTDLSTRKGCIGDFSPITHEIAYGDLEKRRTHHIVEVCVGSKIKYFFKSGFKNHGYWEKDCVPQEMSDLQRVFPCSLRSVCGWYFLALCGVVFNMGVTGIAWVMCLDWSIRGVIFILRQRSGKWKNFRII